MSHMLSFSAFSSHISSFQKLPNVESGNRHRLDGTLWPRGQRDAQQPRLGKRVLNSTSLNQS